MDKFNFFLSCLLLLVCTVALTAPVLAAPAAPPAVSAGGSGESYAPLPPPGLPSYAPQAAPAREGQAAPPPPASRLSGIADLPLSWGGYFQALAVLCFILALLWALLWMVKRHGRGAFMGGSSAALRVESRLALGPKKWIMVIRYRDRRLLLGLTDERISLLADMPAEDPAEAPAPRSSLGKRAAARPAGGDPGEHDAAAGSEGPAGAGGQGDQFFAKLLHGAGNDDEVK